MSDCIQHGYSGCNNSNAVIVKVSAHGWPMECRRRLTAISDEITLSLVRRRPPLGPASAAVSSRHANFSRDEPLRFPGLPPPCLFTSTNTSRQTVNRHGQHFGCRRASIAISSRSTPHTAFCCRAVDLYLHFIAPFSVASLMAITSQWEGSPILLPISFTPLLDVSYTKTV